MRRTCQRSSTAAAGRKVKTTTSTATTALGFNSIGFESSVAFLVRAAPDFGRPLPGERRTLRSVDELIESRKADHLRLSASEDVDATVGAGWEDVRLVHEALPEVDQCAIDLSVDFLGRRLQAPLAIAGMTGGHAVAHDVNAVLARAAERHGLAMGVGSQRAALRRADLAYTYTVVRDQAPTAFLLSNIGAPQLIAQGDQPPLGLHEVSSAIDMIGADALAI